MFLKGATRASRGWLPRPQGSSCGCGCWSGSGVQRGRAGPQPLAQWSQPWTALPGHRARVQVPDVGATRLGWPRRHRAPLASSAHCWLPCLDRRGGGVVPSVCPRGWPAGACPCPMTSAATRPESFPGGHRAPGQGPAGIGEGASQTSSRGTGMRPSNQCAWIYTRCDAQRRAEGEAEAHCSQGAGSRGRVEVTLEEA